jgi:hypothetical protein
MEEAARYNVTYYNLSEEHLCTSTVLTRTNRLPNSQSYSLRTTREGGIHISKSFTHLLLSLFTIMVFGFRKAKVNSPSTQDAEFVPTQDHNTQDGAGDAEIQDGADPTPSRRL